MLAHPGALRNGPVSDFECLQRELDQGFRETRWPSGIRSGARGTDTPVSVGSTPEQFAVYLFAASVDPESLDATIQQNLLTVAAERRLVTGEGTRCYRPDVQHVNHEDTKARRTQTSQYRAAHRITGPQANRC